MREFLAWMLLLTVVGTWVVMPWRTQAVLRLFNARDEEELMRRLGENRRFLASVGLVILMDVVAVALSVSILF